LKPRHVDRFTGYRYYSTDQLSRLYRILALKDLGFALHQVSDILDGGVTGEQLRGMLLLRRSEQQSQIEEQQARLERLEFRLNLIEKENTMGDYDVVIKEVPAQWVASIREELEKYPSIGALYPEIFAEVDPQSIAGPTIAIWHDPEYKETNVDGEAGVYVKPRASAAGRVKVYELPAQRVASLIHHGSFKALPKAYDAAMRWIEANRYQISGPIREVYLHVNMPVSQDHEGNITELQIPVGQP
jgi:effector-binding domain-containing protein